MINRISVISHLIKITMKIKYTLFTAGLLFALFSCSTKTTESAETIESGTQEEATGEVGLFGEIWFHIILSGEQELMKLPM
jgi:hypothetical protein